MCGRFTLTTAPAALAELFRLLAPFPPELMEAVWLAPVVNSVRNDGPECLTPAA
jgi:putative SOS response-associated peptidase YedK